MGVLCHAHLDIPCSRAQCVYWLLCYGVQMSHGVLGDTGVLPTLPYALGAGHGGSTVGPTPHGQPPDAHAHAHPHPHPHHHTRSSLASVDDHGSSGGIIIAGAGVPSHSPSTSATDVTHGSAGRRAVSPAVSEPQSPKAATAAACPLLASPVNVPLSDAVDTARFHSDPSDASARRASALAHMDASGGSSDAHGAGHAGTASAASTGAGAPSAARATTTTTTATATVAVADSPPSAVRHIHSVSLDSGSVSVGRDGHGGPSHSHSVSVSVSHGHHVGPITPDNRFELPLGWMRAEDPEGAAGPNTR